MTEVSERDEAYNRIDRYLRNSMMDDDYAEYSDALEMIAFPPPATPPAAPDEAMVALISQWREIDDHRDHDRFGEKTDECWRRLACADQLEVAVAACSRDAARWREVADKAWFVDAVGHAFALNDHGYYTDHIIDANDATAAIDAALTAALTGEKA